MTTPLRYGIIGSGMMGCEHIRNIAAIPGAEVTAIADPNERSQVWAQKACPDSWSPYIVSDYRDLLARDQVDAVVIATPNHTHGDILADVFETDLHVLVEKPMCTTMSDCQRVVDGAVRHRGIVWVGLEYRYMPPIRAFLAELDRVGELKMLSIREHRFPFLRKVDDWNRFNRNTGGTLVEKCCHFFDLMNLAISRPAIQVFASGAQDVNHRDEIYGGEVPDILDNAFVIVDYEGGIRAHLDLCMFAEASQDEQALCAVGDAGKVEVTVPGAKLTIGDRREKTVTTADVPADDRIRHTGLHHGASYLEHLDFIDAIRSGGKPAVTVEDGLRSVAIGLAAHRSIAENRVVRLDEIVSSAGQQ